MPPDPGLATTLDGLVGRLRMLRAWAGNPSYDAIKAGVNAGWAASGRPAGERVGKSTIVDCFRPGRRRLNADLVLAVVRVLHPDVGYVAHWQQMLRIVSGETDAAAQVRVHDALPRETTGFTGRELELDRLYRALRARPAGRTVVISAIAGMAGVGKTQLAVHAGHHLLRSRRFDHVLFANLRGFDPDPAQPPADPAAVLDGFLRLLGLNGRDVPHDLDGRVALYRARLATRSALIILDNAAGTSQIRPLLPGSPTCPVLVTSRRVLDDLPGATHLSVGVFTAGEAEAFLSRAAPGLPTGNDPTATSRIARRCGYLPLALGLMAGHLRAKPGWSLADHADWLDERHADRRLESGVELALDVSYQHLPESRRRLLRRLVLHPGPDFDVHAAAALADGEAEADLRRLSDDHLLLRASLGRYAFHDLVRIFVSTRAHDEDRPADRDAALTRLFEHYLNSAGAAAHTLYPANVDQPGGRFPAGLTDPHQAWAWLDGERSSLVGVVAHMAGHGWPRHAVRLSHMLFRYLDASRLSKAVTIHEHGLAAARRTGDRSAEAHALVDLGVAKWRLRRDQEVIEHYEQARDLFHRTGDKAGEARAIGNRGLLEETRGNYRLAAGYYRQALVLGRESSSPKLEGLALSNLGRVEGRLGLLEIASEHCAQAVARSRESGDHEAAVGSLNDLGAIETRAGRYRQAAGHLHEALMVRRRNGYRAGEAQVLTNLGRLHTCLGEPEEAAEHHRRALVVYREIGNREDECQALNGLGEACTDPREAARHHEAARAVAAEVGNREELARAHAGLGHAYRRMADEIRAKDQYERALGLYTELDVPEAEAIRAALDG
ncbi:tetratricopeptide repeat protein [Actinoplanes sp. NPDC051411]|uniref:tetratricopeptide repeat protein n=1 Tax=Actinoplanes sp. NPDC051411 TaxID=3155522 RepID=UPI003421CD1C